MVVRWGASSLLDMEKRFRLIMGYQQLWILEPHLDAGEPRCKKIILEKLRVDSFRNQTCDYAIKAIDRLKTSSITYIVRRYQRGRIAQGSQGYPDTEDLYQQRQVRPTAGICKRGPEEIKQTGRACTRRDYKDKGQP